MEKVGVILHTKLVVNGIDFLDNAQTDREILELLDLIIADCHADVLELTDLINN